MTTRVLLVHPPVPFSDLFARGAQSSASVIPPLGLAYIAAYLNQRGQECRILDALAEQLTIKDVCREAESAEVVGITVVSTYANAVIALIRELKRMCPHTLIVVGGPHATAMPRSLLDEGADFAVIGEGEVTLSELIEEHVDSGHDPQNIPGLAFLLDGALHRTVNRRRIEPLDSIPIPARDLLPMHLYRSSVARASRQPSHSMLTSRGCPGVCSFCSKLTFGTHARYFSVPRIIEEFFLLRDTYGARDIAVWDDTFTAEEEIVREVCDELTKHNLGLTWSAEARIDSVTPTTLENMKRAGCTYVAYGIESGSQRILDYIRKGTTLDQMRETVRATRRIGLAVRAYFMLGFPTETLDEMEETVRFAMELDPEVASFTLCVPLPGTVEYLRAQKSGTFDKDYYKNTIVSEFNFPAQPVYVPETMTGQQLMAFHRGAYNRYYMRPKIVLRRILSAITHPEDLAALIGGGKTLLRNLLSR